MREIKFRAWDKRNKKMLSWWDINDGYNFQSMIYEYAMNKDFYDVMQYTGLKDRNGTEIYEGDILKYTNFKREEETLHVWWENEIAGFNFGNRNLSLIKYHIEVIGNIYENLELLEVLE